MSIKYLLFVVLFLFFIKTLGQTWNNYTVDNSGLPSNVITSITIVENTIWITTDNGIASFDGDNWKSYSSSDGISSDNVNNSILVNDTSNEIWFATDSGTTNFSVDNLFITSPFEYWNKSNSNILSDTITTIELDLDFYKWLGSDRGISIVTPSEIVNLQSGDIGVKLNNNSINSFAISTDTVSHRNENYIPKSGVVYAATNGGGVSRFYNHEVDGISSASVVQSMWSGLPSDTVLTVFIDKQNNHWYGTPNGVASHKEHDSKNADWYNYKTDDGLVDNRVTSITSGNDVDIWFGTTGGISKFDGENWESFTEEDGLVSDNVTDIKSDSKNNIWVATDKGLSKLSKLPSSISHNREIVNSYKILLKTFPNPFNLEVNFKLTVPFATNISIQIFNSIGELIKEIDNKFFLSGTHSISWNAHDSNNRIVNSGIYFVRLQTSNMILTKKIILLK